MNIKWWVVYCFVAIVYYAVVWYGLTIFDAGIITTALFLFGIPSLALARFSYAPPAVLVCVATLGFGVVLLLESAAHIFGLWYTLGIDEARLFGLVPVEVFIASVLEVIFLALLYELIFDDGVYTTTNARTRFGAIGVFTIGSMVLMWLISLAEKLFFVSYSYAWVLVIILGASLAALSVYRVYTPQFLDRLVHFSVIGAIPSLIALVLSITNVHKVYANPNEYLFTLKLAGEMVPLEAFLLTLAVPFFVATFYELYLDDKA